MCHYSIEEMIIRHIKSGFKVLGAKLLNKRYPLKINFISTYRCDNNCSYCKIGQLKKTKELSTKQVKSMINSLVNLGAEHITFIGGEPLIRDDMGELITYAKKKGLLTTMSSNGNLFEKKKNQLKDLDLLITCFNGPEKIHDSIRGERNYKKIMKILSLDIGKLATTILTKQNVKYIDFIMNKAKKLGFYVNFQPVFRNELAKVENDEMEEIMLSRKEVRDVFQEIIRRKKNGEPISNSYPSLRNFAKYGKAKFNTCYLGRLSIAIDPEGNVYRCYKYVNKDKKINGFKIGWKEAIKKLNLNNCKECYYGCHIEDNLLYGLNLSSIINLIKLGRIFKNGK